MMKTALLLLPLLAVAFASKAEDAPAEPEAAPKMIFGAIPYAPTVYSGANWLGGSSSVYRQQPPRLRLSPHLHRRGRPSGLHRRSRPQDVRPTYRGRRHAHHLLKCYRLQFL